jgi:hypothetical protein
MLQPGTALLLQCVQLSEGAADLVVESQSVRLLLQLLLRPNVGPATKRHIGGVLQALAATKLGECVFPAGKQWQQQQL